MPYINEYQRKILRKRLQELWSLPPLPTGEMNYIISKFILHQVGFEVNYENYNRMVGLLECCKLELYRRRISDYEDKRRDENGDLY